MKPVSGSPFGASGSPLSLSVAPSDKFLYAALGASGIAVFSINSTGALTLVSQLAPPATITSASSLVLSPNGKFLYVVDGTTTVSAYTVDSATGNLTLIGSPSVTGAKPGTVVVDPLGRYVYTANQGSSDISAFTINADGSLTEISGSPFVTGTQPLGITVDPSSRFVYTANAADQSVSVFAINGTTTPGALGAEEASATGAPAQSLTITR